MSRHYFESVGKLFPCPNPRHEFQFWRVIGSWQWAKKAWCHMNDSGNMVTTFVGITTTETPDGLRLTTLTLWKFCLMIGVSK